MYKSLKIVLPVMFLAAACSSDKEFTKSPVDTLIKDMDKDPTFTIVLHDMDMEDNLFSDKYFHQYKIIKEVNGEITEKTLDKVQVSEDFFWQNENNMGMELAAKDSTGKVSKTPAPAGFTNYVGNARYGQWNNSGGDSFWAFYGRYAMMSSMFNMMSVNRSSYTDYHRNYRGSKPYYGKTTAGRPQFGTNSAHMQKTRPNFFSRRASKSGWSNSSRSSSSSTSRSSSRFGGSSRSRGGSGGGK